MELDKLEIILEKYFRGETTIAEENDLKSYFSSADVPEHLEQYKPIFVYFSEAKEQKMMQEIKNYTQTGEEIPMQFKKQNRIWLSIAVSIIVLLGIATYFYTNKQNAAPVIAQSELGTYNSPEKALAETKKALALLSSNVNTGIESVHYIKEYQKSKNLIFKQH